MTNSKIFLSIALLVGLVLPSIERALARDLQAEAKQLIAMADRPIVTANGFIISGICKNSTSIRLDAHDDTHGGWIAHSGSANGTIDVGGEWQFDYWDVPCVSGQWSFDASQVSREHVVTWNVETNDPFYHKVISVTMTNGSSYVDIHDADSNSSGPAHGPTPSNLCSVGSVAQCANQEINNSPCRGEGPLQFGGYCGPTSYRGTDGRVGCICVQ